MNTPIDLRSFLDHVERLAPGYGHDLDTRFDALPMVQRLALTRWLADRFVLPVDLDVVRQHGTLGDAWRWLDEARRSGEDIRGADQEPEPPVPGITTRVRLRPMVDADVEPLYLASFDPATSSAWRYRGRTLSPAAFIETLDEGVRAQYIVELRSTGEAVGLVSAYDHNQAGLHCKVAFVRFGRRSPGSGGAVMEGMLAFITHLFATFPYRKVFAEVPSYNMGLFEPGFAQEEGVLRDYLFHEGAPADLHIVSFHREQWAQVQAGTGW